MGKNISGSGMDTNVIGRPSNPHEPFPADPKILWIVALDLTDESYGNATGIGNADFTTRRLVDKIDMKPTLDQRHHRVRAERGQGAGHLRDRPRGGGGGAVLHRAHAARASPRDPHQEHPDARARSSVSEAYAADVARRSDPTVLGEAPARLTTPPGGSPPSRRRSTAPESLDPPGVVVTSPQQWTHSRSPATAVREVPAL